MALPFGTTVSTSAMAMKIVTAPFPPSRATVSWSRSRDSSLSMEHQGRSRRSRSSRLYRGRLQRGKLVTDLRGEVGQEAAIDHRPPGDVTQDLQMVGGVF